MAVPSLSPHYIFLFGLLGNMISFMVYLAPLPTFHRIYKKKSTEGFQSVPYLVGLFSAMLWIYYALVEGNAPLLITINSVGCVIQTIYIVIFLKYATRKAKISTGKLLLAMNVGLFGLILLVTLVLTKGPQRAVVLGWICVAFSVSVYVAPLSIIRLVIRTRSVEFMPFTLSFFLTLSAIVWFGYGFLKHDKYVAIPNILGFAFGSVQMILYFVYKNAKPIQLPLSGTCKNTKDDSCNKQENNSSCPEHIVAIVKLTTITTPAAVGAEVHPIDSTSTSGSSSPTAADHQKETDQEQSMMKKEAEMVMVSSGNNNDQV